MEKQKKVFLRWFWLQNSEITTYHDEVLDLEEGLLLEPSDSLDRLAILCPTWIGSGLSCWVLAAILARHSSCKCRIAQRYRSVTSVTDRHHSKVKATQIQLRRRDTWPHNEQPICGITSFKNTINKQSYCNATIFLVTTVYFSSCSHIRGSIVLEAQCFKPEGRGFETWWGEWIFNLPNHSGRTRPCRLLSL
jgi:hypothetical protein